MESKTGHLWLTDGKSRRHRLKAFVYTDSPDPFVVFYQDSKWMWNKPCAFLRLRDAIVKDCGETMFTIVPRGERLNEGPSYLTFSAESFKEKEAWLQALRVNTNNEIAKMVPSPQRKISSRTRSRTLPSIKESDEAENRQPSIICA